ncbi:MAG: 5-(carboxyamino)imidazole ribonucleotide mutase [Nitrososphaera sp.]|nr:5-(carboxyamino)imidazole ribonucleotide mutase [Nitrososphaera sp.]
MTKALVGVIMGSDSDLPVMKEAKEVLEEFRVTCHVDIVSAHRTTEKMVRYAKSAKDRGIEVIIAGAGGAAHLPGMVASLTPLPVIGVPIKTKNLDGLDSLLSIVQMPAGVPVATVAINGARNAGILACQILAIKHPEISKKVERYKKQLESEVLQRARNLQTSGVKKYLQTLADRK